MKSVAEEGFDPYGKDLSKITNGKEMVFRFRDGHVSVVPPEEVEAAKLPPKKPKTNKRGNKFL